MPDREKIVKGLNYCLRRSIQEHENCPYIEECDKAIALNAEKCPLLDDLLALLREQEPLTIHDPGAICPNCKWPLYPEDHPNYCGNCGKAVKWDEI